MVIHKGGGPPDSAERALLHRVQILDLLRDIIREKKIPFLNTQNIRAKRGDSEFARH
tara:strand:+ start:455 stop:625 length:171 start_codon:yes stop_codon:yes gene_type:complete